MPVKLNGATSGGVTLDVPAVAGSNTLTLPAATDTLVGCATTDTLTNKTLSTGCALGTSLIVQATVKTASGTSVDFTGIPSWVKRITVMFNGVSASGTSPYQIQLGTGAGPTFTTTGYVGNAGNRTTESYNSSGFIVHNAPLAAQTYQGNVLIANLSGTTWTEFGVLGGSASSAPSMSGGGVSLAAALTAVRITTVSGTDTFDAGSINILYE